MRLTNSDRICSIEVINKSVADCKKKLDKYQKTKKLRQNQKSQSVGTHYNSGRNSDGTQRSDIESSTLYSYDQIGCPLFKVTKDSYALPRGSSCNSPRKSYSEDKINYIGIEQPFLYNFFNGKVPNLREKLNSTGKKDTLCLIDHKSAIFYEIMNQNLWYLLSHFISEFPFMEYPIFLFSKAYSIWKSFLLVKRIGAVNTGNFISIFISWIYENCICNSWYYQLWYCFFMLTVFSVLHSDLQRQSIFEQQFQLENTEYSDLFSNEKISTFYNSMLSPDS